MNQTTPHKNRMANTTSVALLLLLLLGGCHVGRYAVYNFADLKDYKKFPSHHIDNSNDPFYFHQPETKQTGTELFGQLPETTEYVDFDTYMDNHKTVAFLVVRNDTLIYENYWDGYDSTAIIPSFSMAKSYISALMGIAIEEGHVTSVKQPITDYLTEFKDSDFDRITIENLLNMESGIEFNESYLNPFGNVAKAYYGTNLKKHISKLTISENQGYQAYKSIDTHILGWIIERATGKNVSTYLEEKIWLPLGMEYDASWSIDSKKNDTEKAFCCINARARDFAKFGRLYLNDGIWEGKQIVPAAWVKQCHNKRRRYAYQWWLRPDGFSALGHLGQYIMVFPEENAVVVRMGKNYGGVNWENTARKILKVQ